MQIAKLFLLFILHFAFYTFHFVMRFLDKLKQSLAKTSLQLVKKFEQLVFDKKYIDKELEEEIFSLLIQCDLGVRATQRIINNLKEYTSREKIENIASWQKLLKQQLNEILTDTEELQLNDEFAIILFVGVNGTGKTTSVAKLAQYLKNKGKKVLVAAADTYRAAAIHQLELLCKKIDVNVIKQKEGADPAAVVFDAIKSATANNMDVLIIDTAGRLHTKVPLMEELKKIKRVIDKNATGHLKEVLLTLDATFGQNALVQAKIFKEAVSLTGIFLTKLDGTAKGGVIINIYEELKIPVKLIGIGEKLEDIKEFNPEEFIEALFVSDR